MLSNLVTTILRGLPKSPSSAKYFAPLHNNKFISTNDAHDFINQFRAAYPYSSVEPLTGAPRTNQEILDMLGMIVHADGNIS